MLIVLMSATTFTTQKQLMSKNMPADAMNNPFAQQQKILLYVFPLVFAVSGVNFPIGVLLYWLTTNVWSMGQQFYVIRRNPAPGSPAAEALERRQGRRRRPAPSRSRLDHRGAEASAGGAVGTATEAGPAPTSPSRAASASSRATRSAAQEETPDAAPAPPGRAPGRPDLRRTTGGHRDDRVARGPADHRERRRRATP